MIRFSNIAYVALVLSILLSSAPIASAYQTSEPVTYRAELTPFHERLTWKQRIPPEGGPIGVDLEATVNPGTITAEVSGDIHFDTETGIMSVHGTRGKLSSNGDAVLKGNVTMDFGVPLSEAFFGENQNYHVKQEIELPGLNIKKDWNKSGTFDTSGTLHPLLLGYDESFTLYIPQIELAATGLGAAEIVPAVASASRNGADLTGAAKVFIDNLSDYLDARVSLYATLSSQPTLSGKSVTVDGTVVSYTGDSTNFGETQEIKVEGGTTNIEETQEIKVEGVPIVAPNFRRPHFRQREEVDFGIYKVAYKIESGYDAEITYTMGLNVQVHAHANVSICGGIEIWSYTKPPAPATQFPLLSEQTFDLDFSDAEPFLKHIRPVGNADRDPTKGVIPNERLAWRVRRTLGIVPERPPLSADDPKNPPLSADDMQRLKTLNAGHGSIESLIGLEHAVNLTELYLQHNDISDVSPLSTLTNLKILNLAGNPISELSLSGLTNLTNLTLAATKPSKVSLSDMPNLTKLDVNPFWELSLSNLPKLEVRSIASLTEGFKLSVSDMPQLTTFGLTEVSISELSLSGLPQLTKLTLYNTNISALSLSDMPQLTELNLQRSNNISELSLSGLPQLTKLTLQYSNLSALSLPNMPKLTELNLSSTNLSALSLPDMPQLKTLSLRGSNLSALSLPNMPKLTMLNLQSTNLSALSLSDMPQLTTLYLDLSNLSALSLPNMPKLTTLELGGSNLSALSLPNMPKLTTLTLGAKSISDISALSGLTQLTELNLYLSDTNTLALSLSGLTQLTTLNVSGNSISEVSLSDMPRLTELNLAPNRIISVVSLSDMPQLTTLNLSDTNLSALSLSDMPQLTTLMLSSTHISDIASLLELPNLKELHLRNTPLNYVSRNTYIPALRKKGVSVEFYGRSAHLEKISGEGQIGVLNTELPLPFVVKAFDWGDNPIPNVPVKFVIYQGEGTLSTTTTTTDATGKAETRLTFGSDPGEIKVGVIANSPELKTSVSFTTKCGDEDVNRDGTVNINDLLQVAANLGETGGNPADINCNGVVNIIDLTRVAGAFGEAAAAPATHAAALEHLTATEVAQWLQEAKKENLTDPDFQRGVEVLKNLLTLFVDVNRDGTVNIQDLVQVSANIGATDKNRADVNGDGVVNIQDLVAVAAAFGKGAAAPAAHATIVENLTATEVTQWLHAAQQANLTDPAFQRGVEVLKHLLSLLVPKETVLLANYPNPFNPETWIPYQLADPAEVRLRIHAVDGSLVRTLSLGHKEVGIYQSRTRAAYWDGKNGIGEPVASGVYFYTLTAGDFTATRRMLILK